MSDRIKLMEAKKALLSTLSQGKANPSDIDSGVEVIDVDPRVIAKQNSARSELANTLSGKSEPKMGFPVNSLVSATDSAAVTPDQARSSLIKTMSRGRSPVETPPFEESTVHYFTPDGHQIASTVTPGSIMKLNQAKRDLRGMMANLEDTTKIAMAKDKIVKTMQKQNAFGIPNQGFDSSNTITPSGVPYAPDHPITCRGRSYEQLLAEESVDKPSPSPAVASGQDADEDGNVSGDGDYSPTETQKEPEFSPEKVKADLVAWAMVGGGKIARRKAKSVFLVQNGRGDSADDYEVPLATIGRDGEPQYHPKLLDDAYDHASGKYNNIANRSLQNRIIRLKKKAGHSLSSEQADYSHRHMSAASPFYSVEPDESEVDLATIKYDEQYQEAIRALHKTLRGDRQ